MIELSVGNSCRIASCRLGMGVSFQYDFAAAMFVEVQFFSPPPQAVV